MPLLIQCPVKSCGYRFAIRSNCLAHGRTRHNRSFKPIVVDITKGEEFPQFDEGAADDDDDADDVEEDEDSTNGYRRGSQESNRFGKRKAGDQKRPRRLDVINRPLLPQTKEQRIERDIRYFEEQKEQAAGYVEWTQFLETQADECRVNLYNIEAI